MEKSVYSCLLLSLEPIVSSSSSFTHHCRTIFPPFRFKRGSRDTHAEQKRRRKRTGGISKEEEKGKFFFRPRDRGEDFFFDYHQKGGKT